MGIKEYWKKNLTGIAILFACTLLAACNSSDDSSVDPEPPSVENYSIGGTLDEDDVLGTGLVLKLNGDHTTSIAPGDTSFSFDDPIPDGSSYQISVDASPRDPWQTCDISPSSGEVSGQDITDISVECSTRRFRVGGEISGLQGSGLVVELSDGQTYEPESSGEFFFATPILDQDDFSVSIAQQPQLPDQQCAISGNEGTIDEADYTDVSISCVTDLYMVSGEVHGLLPSDQGLVLALNGQAMGVIEGSDDSEPDTFQFEPGLPTGAEFSVSVDQSPSGPIQHCSVSNGNGVIGDDVHDQVRVDCSTAGFNVGGTVSGLEGEGFQISLNGDQTLAINANGDFQFDSPVADHSSIEVSIVSAPSAPSQTCEITGDGGTVDGSDYDDIAINCETDQFTVGGTVVNLLGDSVRLTLNASNSIDVVSNGSEERDFVFSSVALDDGSSFTVSVESSQQPRNPNQECSVVEGSEGVLDGENYRDVVVVCTTEEYRVRGTVVDLESGSSVGLRLESDNGSENITRGSNGSFSFSQRVEDHGSWSVSVTNQPGGPSQTCEVTPDSGSIDGEDVDDIEVSCEVNQFSVGGSISGLEGSGLRLRFRSDDAGINVTRDVSGNSFILSPPKLDDLSDYRVTVASHPTGVYQDCSVANGTGNLNGSNVTNVSVSCTTRTFKVGGTVTSEHGPSLIEEVNSGETSTTGNWQFTAEFESGHEYSVSAFMGDGSPCGVFNGNAVVGNSDVTDIEINCRLIIDVGIDGGVLLFDWSGSSSREYKYTVHDSKEGSRVLGNGYVVGTPAARKSSDWASSSVLTIERIVTSEDEKRERASVDAGIDESSEEPMLVQVPPSLDQQYIVNDMTATPCAASLMPVAWETALGSEASQRQVSSAGQYALAISSGRSHWLTFEWSHEDVSWELTEESRIDGQVTDFVVDAFNRRVFVRNEQSELAMLTIGEDGLPEEAVGEKVQVDDLMDYVVDPAGRWLAALTEDGVIKVYSVDPYKGRITHVDSVSQGGDWLALRPGGEWLYVGDREQNALTVYQVDADRRALSVVATEGMIGDGSAFRFTPDGRFMVVADKDVEQRMRIDASGLPSKEDILTRCQTEVPSDGNEEDEDDSD